MQDLLTTLVPVDSSVRLQNLIKRLPSTDVSPYLTVADYLSQKAVFVYQCRSLPRVGEKTVAEWCGYIEGWIESKLLSEIKDTSFEREDVLDKFCKTRLVQLAAFPTLHPSLADWIASSGKNDSQLWPSVEGSLRVREIRQLAFLSSTRGKHISSVVDLIYTAINQSNSYEGLAKQLKCRELDLVLLGLISNKTTIARLEKTDGIHQEYDEKHALVLQSFVNISLISLIQGGETSPFSKKMIKFLIENGYKDLNLSQYLSMRTAINKTLSRQKGVGKKKVEELERVTLKSVYVLLRLTGLDNHIAKGLAREICLTSAREITTNLSDEDIKKINKISNWSNFEELYCVVDLGFNAFRQIKVHPTATIDRLLKIALTEKELFVVKNRYGLEQLRAQTLEQLGQILGVTRERGRQIEAKALRKLKVQYRTKLFSKFLEADVETIISNLGLSGDFVSDAFLTGWRRLLDGYHVLAISILYGDVQGFLDSFMDREKRPRSVGTFWLKKDLLDDEKEQILAQANTLKKVKNPIAAVRECIALTTWPISIEAIRVKASWLTKEKVIEILEKNFGAIIDKDHVVSIKPLPSAVRCTMILRTQGRAMSLTEIRSRHKQFFGVDMSEHSIGATLARLDNALIVERGTYDIYENLTLTSQDICLICEQVEEYLDNAKAYTSTKVILSNIDDSLPSEVYQELGPYTLLGICQDDERFDCRRGLMIGLAKSDFQAEFKRLGDEIYDVVVEHGPISVPEICDIISTTRDVFYTTIGKIIYDSEFLVASDRGLFDTVERVIGDNVRVLQLAIQVALVDGDTGIPLLLSRLLSVGLDYNSYTIVTFLAGCNFVERDGDTFSLSYHSQALKQYNELFYSRYDSTFSPEQNKQNIIDTCDDEELIAFAENDYRLHVPSDEWGANQGDEDEKGIINSILSDFEF